MASSENISNVSGQMTITPEDDRKIETGCVSSPMTNASLSGDNYEMWETIL